VANAKGNLTPNLEKGGAVMDDAVLEQMADRFCMSDRQRVLAVSFVDYLASPEFYELLYEWMKRGGGLCMSGGQMRPVLL